MIGTVTKEFRFEAAHRLMNHPAKCRNLHGHSYKLVVTVAGNIDKATGMVIDFGLLSTAVNSLLDEGFFLGKPMVPFDHSLMLHEEDPLAEVLADSIEKLELRYIPMIEHPTAEYMSRLFFTLIDKQLQYLMKMSTSAADVLGGVVRPVELGDPYVLRVEVWETAKCYAAADSRVAEDREETF